MTSSAIWTDTRREELLELFRVNIYGRAPVGKPADLTFNPTSTLENAFNNTALRQTVRGTYTAPAGRGNFDLTIYYPANGSPKACLLLIVHRERSIISGAETNPRPFWPVQDLIARGYATAVIHVDDFAVDDPSTSLQSGVLKFYPYAAARPKDAWAAISAWAW